MMKALLVDQLELCSETVANLSASYAPVSIWRLCSLNTSLNNILRREITSCKVASVKKLSSPRKAAVLSMFSSANWANVSPFALSARCISFGRALKALISSAVNQRSCWYLDSLGTVWTRMTSEKETRGRVSVEGECDDGDMWLDVEVVVEPTRCLDGKSTMRLEWTFMMQCCCCLVERRCCWFYDDDEWLRALCVHTCGEERRQ